jgi:hypothetical protein
MPETRTKYTPYDLEGKARKAVEDENVARRTYCQVWGAYLMGRFLDWLVVTAILVYAVVVGRYVVVGLLVRLGVLQ